MAKCDGFIIILVSVNKNRYEEVAASDQNFVFNKNKTVLNKEFIEHAKKPPKEKPLNFLWRNQTFNVYLYYALVQK